MAYDRLAARLYGRPHAITPDRAAQIEEVFRACWDGRGPKNEGPARETQEAQYVASLEANIGRVTRTDGGYLLTGEGLAIVPVLGSLVHRGTMFDAMSGLTSYERIGGMLDAAMADYRVQGVALDIDSHGGEGAGVIDLARRVNAASKRKPVYAAANEHAFSAAYWIASAAGRIVMPESALVGSVGVVMMHVDQSRMNDKRGLTVTHIYAGERKVDFSPHAPLSDRARADAQAIVDRMYEQFVGAVSEHRGVDAQIVRDTEAGVLNADDAVALELADDVGTLADALQMMRDELRSGARSYGRRAESSATSLERNQEMADAKQQDKPATTTTTAATDEQLAAAKASGASEGKAAGTKEGADAERARVKAILEHAEAAGRTKLAQHCAFNTQMSVDEAAAMLAAAPKEATAQANPLAQAMAGVPNPKVGADAGGDKERSGGGKVVSIDTAAIYRNLNQQLADAHKARGR